MWKAVRGELISAVTNVFAAYLMNTLVLVNAISVVFNRRVAHPFIIIRDWPVARLPLGPRRVLTGGGCMVGVRELVVESGEYV